MSYLNSSSDLVIASNAFKLAAILYAVSIMGHTIYGFTHVYHVLDTIQVTPDTMIGRYGPQYAWNYINDNFAVMALLNWQWSLSGGPGTIIEKLIFWINILVSLFGGYRYLIINSYQPLIPLWYANFASVAGWYMAECGESCWMEEAGHRILEWDLGFKWITYGNYVT